MIGGWEIKKLGDVATINYGYTASATEIPNGPKFLRITDIQNNVVYWEKVPYCQIDNNDLPKYQLNEGDIVFARTGATTGKSFLIKNQPNSIFASYLIRLRIKPSNDLLPEFLYLFFQTNEYWGKIKSGTIGSAQGGFNASKLSELLIPYPPLPEQQRIVAILDQAFAAIAKAKENAEKNLKNAREVFESYLNSVFANPGKAWHHCKLEDYIKFIDYRGKTPLKQETGMRLITAKNVKEGYLQKFPEEYVDPYIYNDWMTRGIPRKGDVLFTTEAPLANVAQLDTDEKVVFAQRIIILQPKVEVLNQTFLKYLILSKPIKHRIINAGTGMTVQGIKSSLLKKIDIYFPNTLLEQKKIIKVLDDLTDKANRLEAIYRQKFNGLEELKKSLLYKAFNGKLTKKELEVKNGQ